MIRQHLIVLPARCRGYHLITSSISKALGELPTMDELRGKLVGLIQAPAAQIARVLKAYADKEEQAA